MGKAFAHRSAGHNDFQTHTSMTKQLLMVERFNKKKIVMEPASGKGFLLHVLRDQFNTVYSFDQKYGVDFLTAPIPQVPYIITNPPYGKEADCFVNRCKQKSTDKFALLLRTNFLSGQARYEGGIYDGLKRVHIFTRMPTLGPVPRDDGKYPTGAIVYAWMVWDASWRKDPMVNWIDNQRFVLKKGDV